MLLPDAITSTALTAAVTGFATCLALLSSLGAQNLLLIRHGMQRHRTGLVAGIFLVSDVVLVVLGVLGVAGALAAAPLLREMLTVAGAAFLFWLAVGAVRRARTLRRGPSRRRRAPAVVGAADGGAWNPPTGVKELDRPDPDTSTGRTSGWAVAGAAVAVTWLNPQVLLETMFVLGTAGTSHGASGQWWFVAGSVLASTVWFCGIGYAARSLSGVLRSPTIWYVLEVITAIVMTLIGVGLLRGLW